MDAQSYNIGVFISESTEDIPAVLDLVPFKYGSKAIEGEDGATWYEAVYKATDSTGSDVWVEVNFK